VIAIEVHSAQEVYDILVRGSNAQLREEHTYALVIGFALSTQLLEQEVLVVVPTTEELRF
jgi:hypothetical protein